MDKEYRANQRKQKKTFKKFRKYIGRIFLWAGIGIASAAFFPGAAVMSALKGVMGDLLATSVAFFGQWGIAGVGFIGAMVNAIKAHHAAKTIDNSQEEEENIVDCIVRDKDNLQIKVDNLSRTKELEDTKAKALENELIKNSEVATTVKEDAKPHLEVLKGGNSSTKPSKDEDRPHLEVLPGGLSNEGNIVDITKAKRKKTG